MTEPRYELTMTRTKELGNSASEIQSRGYADTYRGCMERGLQNDVDKAVSHQHAQTR